MEFTGWHFVLFMLFAIADPVQFMNVYLSVILVLSLLAAKVRS